MSIIINNEQNYFELTKTYYVNGYSTFSVIIKSRGFSGQGSICLSEEMTDGITKRLESMWRTLKGEVEIGDLDSTNTIKVKMTDNGRILIVGSVGTMSLQYLRFEFSSDQTVINTLIKSINESVGD